MRLASIHQHIAEDSPQTADRFIRRLVERVLQLETAPLSGRRVPEYPDADLRELLYRPYRIIYRQRGGDTEVVTVMHYRQKLPSDDADLRKG